ncbi:MAG: bifunctional precorrin-2 dehydrogenase/sirohydrochlorin ferrochelatase [Anaerotignum sp.]|nr:bifunctional precorrin-2 dehydrogenase/sirohydrochlorin ferrochelatase [Anaerotignum sp.]
MSYFPFFMEIKEKKCLVVGGGMVALRKIEKLLPFGVGITVVSPAFCAEIEGMAGLRRIQRRFEKTDVEGMLFVIGATDDEAVNTEISSLCRERNIPVNIVDDPEKCTFFFPALVKKGEFVAGFSTGGGSPLAAQYIRKKVEDAVPEGFDKVVEALADIRQKIKNEIPDIKKRERIFKEIFALALEKEGNITETEIEKIIRKEGEHA